MTRPARRIAVSVLVASCAVTAACSNNANSPSQSGSPNAGPATTAPATAPTGAAPTAPAAAHTDPCALLTPAAGQAALHKPLGAGRKVSTGDLDECVYDTAGPLIVAVLRGSFTADSLKRMIDTQNAGPYAKTTGPAVPVAGLGDAAYAFGKAGIVEVLKNTAVISVTSASIATSKQVALAVLPRLT